MARPTDYVHDVSKADLMRVVVALATEVFEIRDRQRALESILEETGADLAALDAPIEPAAFDPDLQAERDQFVGRVFEALRQPADARSAQEE